MTVRAVRRRMMGFRGRRRPHLFLCHSSRDKAFVRQLARDLNKLGIDAWLDEWELEPGESLHSQIGWALERSKYVGALITPSFLESRWCLDELDHALIREKRIGKKLIIPLLQGRAMPPPFVEGRFYLNFSKHYCSSLFQLAGKLHHFSAKQIADELENHKVKSVSEVYKSLIDLGWDGYQLIDSHDFSILKKKLKSIGFYIAGDATEISEAIWRRLRKQGVPLAVERKLEKEFYWREEMEIL